MNERDIFLAARENPDPVARAAFLAEACAGDVALRRRVERLLRADARADSFLDTPAILRSDPEEDALSLFDPRIDR
jgi:hypothetical protein